MTSRHLRQLALITAMNLLCFSPAVAVNPERAVGRAQYHEIPGLKEQALSGSTEAARKLASYYLKFPNGSDTHEYWSQIAAENGSAVGEFNHAHYLLRDTDPLSRIRARFWFERAAAQGSQEAKDELRAMDAAESKP